MANQIDPLSSASPILFSTAPFLRFPRFPFLFTGSNVSTKEEKCLAFSMVFACLI